jgi:hypothetical protein
MRPIDVSCRFVFPSQENCGAEAGEPCRGIVPFHACRIEDAAAMTRDADPISVEAFDRAVEEKLF